MDLQIGELFNEQIEHNGEPHRYEGGVYVGSSDAVYMFCQVGYSKFAFINLDEGNRVWHGVQLRVKTHPELGGCNERGVLRMMYHQMDERLTYKGKLNDWLRGLA